MPRAYGYAPEDSELYKTEAEKDAARQKMFDSMDPHPIIDNGSVDQYKTFIKAAVSCCGEGTFATAASSPSSPEHVELYWYLLEIFTDHDLDKDGIIKMAEFPAMMNEF